MTGALTAGPGRPGPPGAGAVAPALLARPAHRHSGPWLIGAGAGSVVGLVGSVLLYRHAIRTDVLPSPVSGAPGVLVPHWSAPWVLAAAAAALAGLLLAVALVAELVGRRTDRVLQPERALPPSGWGSGDPAHSPADPVHPPADPSGDPAHPPADRLPAHPDDVWRPPPSGTP